MTSLRLSAARLLLTVVLLLFCGHTAFAAPPPQAGGRFPDGFAETTVLTGLKSPDGLAFSPDGRMFICERLTGRLMVAKRNARTGSWELNSRPFYTFDVPRGAYRSAGLRTIVFDPDFERNGYIYAFYMRNSPRHNRVVRIQADPGNPNVARSGSEKLLLEMPFHDGNSPVKEGGSHNGGALEFGRDGKLYIGAGDGWQPGKPVQSLSTFTGKLLRINRDGTIPSDNPFYNRAKGAYRAIYALGLRNPYSMSRHPQTGRLYINETRGNGKDHIYLVQKGANYGQDGYGGLGTQRGPWAKAASAGGVLLTGGDWYPQSGPFPNQYHGNYFVALWGRNSDNTGRISRITSNQNTSVRSFAQNVGNRDPQGYALKPVLTKVGPDGNLYYLLTTYESNYGAVVRVSWRNGGGGQQQAARPVISPGGGSFNRDVRVSLSTSTSGAQIRYTLNDQEPTSTSRLYTGPFPVTTPRTVKAKAFKNGLTPSSTARAVYTRGGGGGSPAAGLLAHWRLDEKGGGTAYDVAGGRNSPLANGPSWRHTGGRLGGALAFDGVDDRVDVKGLEIGGQALTLALWFKADDFGQMDGRLISKAGGIGDEEHVWMLSTMNKTELRFRLSAGGSATVLRTKPNIIRAGRWHHVAAVYDGKTMRIYRDGVEVARRAKTGGISLGRGVAAALGNQPKGAGSRPFDGLLDDVRIYTRALSQNEISALATGQASPPPSSNQRPTASAGPDRSVTTGRKVTLDGSQSTDPDGDDLYISWRWKQLSGPSVKLDSPEEALSSFVPRQSGTYAFRLTVRDRQGAEATDDVTIRVTDVQNQPSALLWVERFDLPEGMKRDNGKTTWSTETTRTKPETFFAVQNSRFEAHATGGEALWVSERINIAGAGPVRLSVDLRSAGALNPDDYVRLHYKLDGKQGVLFAEQKGFFGTKTVRTADLRGSTLEVLVRAKTNARGERYQWDNVAVSTSSQQRAGEAELEATTLALPTEHGLGHAYPNPFNPSTEIPFELPEAGPVSLVVYDVMGREVARLVDGPMEAGYHAAMWDAGELPSGVYLYRLTAGTFTATEQVTLVK